MFKIDSESEQIEDKKINIIDSMSSFEEFISTDIINQNEDVVNYKNDEVQNSDISDYSGHFELISSSEEFVNKDEDNKDEDNKDEDNKDEDNKDEDNKDEDNKNLFIKNCSLEEFFDISKSSENKIESELLSTGSNDSEIYSKEDNKNELKKDLKNNTKNKIKNDIENRINELDKEDNKILMFKTGSNKNISINSKVLKRESEKISTCLKNDIENRINDLDKEDNKILIFKTGSNKNISINSKVLKRESEKISTCLKNDYSEIENLDKELLEENIKKYKKVKNNEKENINKELIEDDEINIYSKVNKEIIKNEKMIDKILDYLYKQMKNKFPKRENEWIIIQMKWAWMHIYINEELLDIFNLEQTIYEIMKSKLSDEKSILRRIVEFDDISERFMEVGILKIDNKIWEIFDGYYSINIEVDELIDHRKYRIGDKIYLFGSEMINKTAKSIYEIGNEVILKIRYNGLRKARKPSRLGYKQKVGFLLKIGEIKKEGGPVSGIEVKIKKILEKKYLVYIKNYRNTVEDLEEELEKINELCKKAGNEINPEDLNIRRYCKMVIEDSSGECLLTWWNYNDDIQENEWYKFIYLTNVLNYNNCHLSTSRKTFIQKLF